MTLITVLASANIEAKATKIIDGTEEVKNAMHIYVGEKPH